MDFDLQSLVRENIKSLKPYSSARHEFKGEASVFLDANENSYGSPVQLPLHDGQAANFNRYPDPLQWQLKFAIAQIKGVPAENIFIGNGSDEVIDLAYRIFCEPSKNNVIVCPPTYGMYQVSAGINDVEIRKVNLTERFQLDTEAILNATNEDTRLLFICSPNNPTGNNMRRIDVEFLLNNFPGLILIDEAYINFSRQKTFIQELIEYPNLIVMQTLSKAWGLASLRLGLAFASQDIIDLFNKIKPPYNINQASQQLALKALQNTKQVNNWIKECVEQRKLMTEQLCNLPVVKKVYESDANFILVKVADADKLYNFLSENSIVVRNRSKEVNCDNCLRITIGTPQENAALIKILKSYEQ
jgi:histidinol-phosphate aminotransferase